MAAVRIDMAVTPVPGRVHAVEEIYAALHAFQYIGRCTYSHKISRFVAGQMRHDRVQHAVHLLVGLPHGQAAHSVAVQVQLGDLLRVFDADILENGPLVNPEQQLMRIDCIRKGIEPRHFIPAAHKPSGRPFDGRPHVVPVRRRVRAFVKCHGDRGSKIGLDLHALLRSHKYLPPVHMGMEVNPFFLDFTQLCKGEDLKSAGIRQDRPVPVHELPDASQFFYEPVPRPHMQVVRITQFHLAVQFLQLRRRNAALDRSNRPHVHEDRGLDHPVYGGHAGPFGPAFGFQEFIHQSIPPIRMHPQLFPAVIISNLHSSVKKIALHFPWKVQGRKKRVHSPYAGKARSLKGYPGDLHCNRKFLFTYIMPCMKSPEIACEIHIQGLHTGITGRADQVEAILHCFFK